MNQPTDSRRLNGSIAFWIVVALFVAYAACFIYRTSFVIGGERYFSLFDDAMVSMRYARNLARGYGLVWNRGSAPVEGFTNPLWVAYMAAVHELPLPLAKTSLVIQLTAMVLLTLNLFVVRDIARSVSDGPDAVALGAVVLTATYLPINNWSLQGMEVSVLVLVMSVALCIALRSMRDGTFRGSPYVLLGASTLVRLDMAVPLAGLLLFNIVVDQSNRRRHIVWGVTSLVGLVTLQTAFRLWYFGDLLPNTYYLKMTGYPVLPRVGRGLFVLAQFIWMFSPLLFALPLIAVRVRGRLAALPLWALAVQMLYSVWVGGDAWEYWGGSNRYISIAMPGFFAMLSYALFYTAHRLLGAPAPGRQSRTPAVAFAVLIGVAVVSGNSIYPGAWAEVLLIHAPLHSGPGDENDQEVEEALRLRAVTTADATVAVTRAGTIPYFSDRPSIDLLGKTDRHVAHEMSRVPPGLRHFREFRPGHTKFDYGYSIEQLTPDVILQLWNDRDDVRPYLRQHYRAAFIGSACVYVNPASLHVLQDKMPVEDCNNPP